MTNPKSIHTHVAFSDEKGIYAIKRDGELLVCPKTMYPQVNAFQKTSVSPVEYLTNVMRMPCSTGCPFAEVKIGKKTKATDTGSWVETDEDEYIYEISCEGRVKEIPLDSVDKFKKETVKSPLQIIDK